MRTRKTIQDIVTCRAFDIPIMSSIFITTNDYEDPDSYSINFAYSSDGVRLCTWG